MATGCAVLLRIAPIVDIHPWAASAFDSRGRIDVLLRGQPPTTSPNHGCPPRAGHNGWTRNDGAGVG
ncbi:hypothetical protein MY1884_005217 [Beauveria asiatica]